ncbi:hypothetical protein [Bacillus salipaludis]|uniref:Uncharacterized protein n=1 Tax=Bacillus salipaludis TaxID=2547811 RepID=A0ABW8RHP2_9BACI
MEKKYPTNILFICAMKDMGANSNVVGLMKSMLNQSLKFLSTVINIISFDQNLSDEAKGYLNRFANIKEYNGKMPPLNSKEIWSIEEFTILIIMLRCITRKRYSSMNETILTYMESGESPSDKVIQENQKWLLEAYKCLGVLKHYNWSEKIDEDLLPTLVGSDLNIKDARKNIQDIEKSIKKSGVLDGEMDSGIGQILAKCAYPELLKTNKRSSAAKLMDAIAEVMASLEKIEGVLPQEIAIIESIKKLNKLKEDIEFSFDTSKYYTETYWEHVMGDDENEADLSLIKKQLMEKFAVELDTIEKNTL